MNPAAPVSCRSTWPQSRRLRSRPLSRNRRTDDDRGRRCSVGAAGPRRHVDHLLVIIFNKFKLIRHAAANTDTFLDLF